MIMDEPKIWPLFTVKNTLVLIKNSLKSYLNKYLYILYILNEYCKESCP